MHAWCRAQGPEQGEVSALAAWPAAPREQARSRQKPQTPNQPWGARTFGAWRGAARGEVCVYEAQQQLAHGGHRTTGDWAGVQGQCVRGGLAGGRGGWGGGGQKGAREWAVWTPFLGLQGVELASK